jgi:hypothetical protein
MMNGREESDRPRQFALLAGNAHAQHRLVPAFRKSKKLFGATVK